MLYSVALVVQFLDKNGCDDLPLEHLSNNIKNILTFVLKKMIKSK